MEQNTILIDGLLLVLPREILAADPPLREAYVHQELARVRAADASPSHASPSPFDDEEAAS